MEEGEAGGELVDEEEVWFEGLEFAGEVDVEEEGYLAGDRVEDCKAAEDRLREPVAVNTNVEGP